MTAVLQHRGPDEDGFWSDDQISLGFRRLAIVDIGSGNQPAKNEDASVISVFNGEIYNHVQLRAELSKRGHRFDSHHSDAEIIPHLYEEYGLDFPQHLNGMFAIAIWDARKQQLVLVRDRVGIKPLYYTENKQNLIFASEIKSILQNPDVERKPNMEAIYHYFSFKNVPSPMTAFQGVHQLSPGEMLIHAGGKARTKRWWSLTPEDSNVGFDEAARRVRELLEDSVRLQMNADVEVGAYLSGGVDSSSVTALMSRHASKRIKTFTLVYEEDFQRKSQDRINAQRVSEMYDTDHYEYVMTEKDFWAELENITDAFDEPFSGVTSTYFLTKLIAKHVKVTLSGDGADELFGSYLPHRVAQPLHRYHDMNLDQRQAWQHPEFSKAFMDELISQGDESERRMQQYLWSDCDKGRLFSHSLSNKLRKTNTRLLIDDVLKRCQSKDPLTRALYLDFHMLLPDQVLTFVDRLSMAHSVEVRPPFLDHRLVEYAFSIKGKHKVSDNDVKRVLKAAVSDLLPEEIIKRPKEGFVLPINNWLQTNIRHKVGDYLNKTSIQAAGLFQWEEIDGLVDAAQQGQPKALMKVWNLIVFQIWWDRYFG
jgi:asparagine synthase (glutamine-hydrolysing)